MIGGDRTALLEHWQALRKRLARNLGVEPSDVHYRGVRTTEGHGVLHLIVAVDPAKVGHRWRLVDFEHLQDWWRELHGAWHVNVKRIRSDSVSARRVSRYVVSQYLVRQGGELVDALVRTFGSRLELRLPELRRQFRKLVWWRRWELIAEAFPRGSVLDDESIRSFRRALWAVFRNGWASLLATGHCEVFGARLCLVQINGWRVEER